MESFFRWRLRPVLVRDVGADPSARVRRRRLLVGAPVVVVRMVLYTIAVLMILRIFRLNTGAELLPMGLALLAVGLVVAYGPLRDALSGYFILYDHIYSEGDEVVIGEVEGTVDQMTLRHTRLRTPDGQLITIPHRHVGTVTNRSRGEVG